MENLKVNNKIPSEVLIRAKCKFCRGKVILDLNEEISLCYYCGSSNYVEYWPNLKYLLIWVMTKHPNKHLLATFTRLIALIYLHQKRIYKI